MMDLIRDWSVLERFLDSWDWIDCIRLMTVAMVVERLEVFLSATLCQSVFLLAAAPAQ